MRELLTATSAGTPSGVPTFADVDISLFKNIKVSERVNFQFRAEAFNILNRTNLYLPNMRLGQATSLFGESSQAYDHGRSSSR